MANPTPSPSRAGLLLVALIASGCVSMETRAINLKSVRTFDVSERPQVWGRALTAMQMKGFLVSATDPVGGFLRTEIQSTSASCSNADVRSPHHRPACSVWVAAQLTVTPDGTAFLSSRYVFSAMTVNEKSPVTDQDIAPLQRAGDDMVDFIVGKSKTPPPSLPQAPGNIGAPPAGHWGKQDI